MTSKIPGIALLLMALPLFGGTTSGDIVGVEDDATVEEVHKLLVKRVYERAPGALTPEQEAAVDGKLTAKAAHMKATGEVDASEEEIKDFLEEKVRNLNANRVDPQERQVWRGVETVLYTKDQYRAAIDAASHQMQTHLMEHGHSDWQSQYEEWKVRMEQRYDAFPEEGILQDISYVHIG